MKRNLVLLAWLLTGILASTTWALDSYYHTNAEIDSELNAWQALYPDSVKVYTIGYSQHDTLPILAVKISDNVNLDQDKPKVLFVGQVHAEECTGVEIVMSLIDSLMTKRFYDPFNFWLSSLEIWMIPTANPEGLQVVTDGLDESYRKNKRDCNLNGIFDYYAGTGGDTDGVDINRNFPLNWVHGDSFLQLGNYEQYDYFRGFGPASESETQALINLGRQKQFAFSVVWHSSRQGGNSQKVFYPWNWGSVGKLSPDYDVLFATADSVARRILSMGSPYPTYQAYDSNEPRGQEHDFSYADHGTIAMLIETGPQYEVQPDSSVAVQVVRANIKGAYYLLDRASAYPGTFPNSQITGLVTNSTGSPIPAVVTILENDGPLLTPRVCDSFGRYRRYLMPGYYTVRASLRGYYPQQAVEYASQGGLTTHDFSLALKPVHSFAGQISSFQMNPLAGVLYIQGEDVSDTVQIGEDGQFWHALPEGAYRLIFDSPGYVVRFDSLNLDQDRYVPFKLSYAGGPLFSDSFENGLGNWIHGGNQDYWGTELDSLWNGGMVASDRPGLDYVNNTYTWLEIATPLDLSNAHTAALRFQHWYYFEPDYDSALVQASSDNGGSWQTVCGPFDRQNTGWGTAYGNLNAYCGQSSVRLRWLVTSDVVNDEQGWHFDEVQVQIADSAEAVSPGSPIPAHYALIQACPNPFNSQLAVLLELPAIQAVNLSLWDLSGRQVARIFSGSLGQGSHRLGWQAPANLAAGIYLLRFEHAEKTDVRKVVFLK